MPRILVVHTTSEPAIDDRIARMAAKPELAACEFHHAYFFRPEDAQESSQMKPQEFLDRNQSRILGRLIRQIESAQIEMVVLHTGVAFLIAPRVVLDIFSELKHRFPDLKLAIQESQFLKSTLEEQSPRFADDIQRTFDHSPETQEMLKYMF